MANLKKVSNNLKNSSTKSRAPKKTTRAFLKRVQNALHKDALLLSGENILVAVSGGPDSMALLSVLKELQDCYQWQLSVAHVCYGLRGADSQKDRQLVEKTAAKFGLPYYVLDKKVASSSSEATLRTARYTFFEKLVQKHNFSSVALAHHQDDQAETFLLRLIRGSGSLGLSAMRPRRGIFVRPFLSFSKSDILDFLKREKIPYRIDRTNTEMVYLRNRVRNELLPLLEKYNPQIKKVLAATAQTLHQESSALALDIVMAFSHDTKQTLSCLQSDWILLSKAEQATFIRSLFQRFGLSLPTKNLTLSLIQDFAKVQKKGFTKDYSRLRVGQNDGRMYIHFKELADL